MAQPLFNPVEVARPITRGMVERMGPGDPLHVRINRPTSDPPALAAQFDFRPEHFEGARCVDCYGEDLGTLADVVVDGDGWRGRVFTSTADEPILVKQIIEG